MLAVLALVAAIGCAAGDDGRQPLREGARVRVLITEDPAAMTATLGKGNESVTPETSRGAVVALTIRF